MGITIPQAKLKVVLERAIAIAESDAELPEVWLERTRRLGAAPAQTYVAALGTALLAKATDDRVDALTVKAKASANAYSMRGVAKVLAGRAAHYGYHLGRTGPEPLNNQPWFGSNRIDRFQNVRAVDAPFHRDMVRYMTDLNALSSEEALYGLAAFLRLRLAYAAEHQLTIDDAVTGGAASLGQLIEILQVFLHDDPEGGRRAQALVAALLDLVHDDVRLTPINDPSGFDVVVRDDQTEVLGVEVKQKPVEEATALHLAEEASLRQVDKGLLVALAVDQRPLDRERIRRAAEETHNVLLVVYEGVAETVAQLALASPCSAVEFAARLPALYLVRMHEHGVSGEGQQFWSDLCAGLDR